MRSNENFMTVILLKFLDVWKFARLSPLAALGLIFEQIAWLVDGVDYVCMLSSAGRPINVKS